MNLLRIQDALKNASDQQLMQMMQAPDSTAPSYLVLSELRRRKDMRAQQAPEGESRRTVAEELLAQDDGGIRNIVAHDEPEAQEGADEMAAGGLASLRGYREGGVVRMQTGGDIMSDVPFPPTSYESMTIPPAFSGIQTPGASPFGERTSNAMRELRARIEANPSLRGDPRLPAQVARQFGLPPVALRAAMEREEGARFAATGPSISQDPSGVVGLGANAPIRPQVAELPQYHPENMPPRFFPGEQQPTQDTELPRVPAPATPATPAQPQGQRPAPPATPARPAQPAERREEPPASETRPAQGIGALRPSNAEGAEANPPNVQFTDRLSPLFERMREGRVDPAARRNEALNMALIEAGLRIAGSRNPSLAGALGEGATPAVQSYAQQLGQIRADQRQDLRDELQGALAQNQNDYYRGRLSQQEFATRQQMLIERLRQSGETDRTRMREAGADARNAATIAGQREPASVQELRYLENLYNTDRAAFERAMRARQTGVGAAEVRGSTAIARAVQDAIGSDRGIQMLNLQRTRLEGMQNRTEAQNQELASIRARIAAAERDIEQRFMRIGAAPGGLPVSNTPTGPGGVVQAPIPR